VLLELVALSGEVERERARERETERERKRGDGAYAEVLQEDEHMHLFMLT
jgi:hypothetical protein